MVGDEIVSLEVQIEHAKNYSAKLQDHPNHPNLQKKKRLPKRSDQQYEGTNCDGDAQGRIQEEHFGVENVDHNHVFDSLKQPQNREHDDDGLEDFLNFRHNVLKVQLLSFNFPLRNYIELGFTIFCCAALNCEHRIRVTI